MFHLMGFGLGLGFLMMFGLLWTFLYFLPAVIAAARHHPNTLAIFVLDLLLGWSVLGWIGALIWSLVTPQPQTIIVQSSPNPPPAA